MHVERKEIHEFMYITKIPIIYFWLVRCTEDPILYFTEVLERALDKSNSKTVTRIIVSRAEVCGTSTTPLWLTQLNLFPPNTFPALFHVLLVALEILKFLALLQLVE